MVNQKSKINLDKIARMVQRGFEASSKDLQEFRAETSGRLSGMENRLDAIEQGFVFLRTEIKDLRHDTYSDIIDLQGRVVRLEKRTGLRR